LARLYEYYGDEALGHRYKKKTLKEKKRDVERVLGSESKNAVDISMGIEAQVISKWVQTYSKERHE
jgi:hypothetical protein